MANPDYPEVGGAWPSDKIPGGFSLKLNNGMYISLAPNKYYEEGGKKPQYRATMRIADAKALGIEGFTAENVASIMEPNQNEQTNNVPF